jgi:glucosamine--fructose-6-phosphate aminotransferase (isomerizing)
VPTSTIARESETVLPTLAGPEIGVASTKAFTCQLMVLAAMAVAAGKARGELSEADEAKLVHGLVEVPRLMSAALATEPQIEKLAREISKSKDVLYLGRGTSYPLALEGALKLKEISYIHAEGYPAAEMKHGPIALVDPRTPSVFLCPKNSVYEKVMANIEEVKARKGPVIVVATEGDENIHKRAEDVIYIPDTLECLQPLLSVLPLQLLAYHIAVLRGCDVDKPRNLAKSVTVE